MKILCACECSQVLTTAWLKAGFDAFSCDLSDSFGNYPERHYKCDVLSIVDDFDAVFAFPPCTDLSYANGVHLAEKIADGRTASAISFFGQFLSRDNVRMVENPLGVIRGYSQIVSPDMFGSDKKKRTCLWLKRLPLLLPTTCKAGKSFIQSLGSFNFKRSILDPFLARAMVSQWGDYVRC